MEKYYIVAIYTIAVVLFTLFIWGYIRVHKLKRYINNECNNDLKVYTMALNFIADKTKHVFILFISNNALYLTFCYFIHNKSFYAFLLGELFIIAGVVLYYLSIAVFCDNFHKCCKYIDKMNDMFEKTNFKINKG